MENKALTPEAISLMHYLMQNETIANKVKAAGKEGKQYAIYTIEDSGNVILGETKHRFWNQLIGCKFTLTFEAFAGCVWDALVDLSTGPNQEALLKGLSKEVLEKAQREKKYVYVIERLVDCYRHVCDNVGGQQPLEGGRGKSGHNANIEKSVTVNNGQPVNVNINVNEHRRTLRFPDASGTANIAFEMGVVDVRVE